MKLQQQTYKPTTLIVFHTFLAHGNLGFETLFSVK